MVIVSCIDHAACPVKPLLILLGFSLVFEPVKYASTRESLLLPSSNLSHPLTLLLLTDLQCPPALEEPPEGKEIPLKGGLRGELVPSPLQSFLLHPLSRIGEGGMKGGTEEK